MTWLHVLFRLFLCHDIATFNFSYFLIIVSFHNSVGCTWCKVFVLKTFYCNLVGWIGGGDKGSRGRWFMYNYGWFAQPPPEVNLKLGLTNRHYQRLCVPLYLCFLLPKRHRICYNQKVKKLCVNTVGDEFELDTLQYHLFSFSVAGKAMAPHFSTLA